MSIHDAVTARLAQAEGVKPRCKLGVLIDGLEPADQDALEYAITLVRDAARTDPLFTIAWLVSMLQENGHAVGKTTISEHVRRVCACDSGQ